MNNINIFRSFDTIDAGRVLGDGSTIGIFDPYAAAVPVYRSGAMVDGRRQWTPVKWADDAIVVLRRHEGWCSLVAESEGESRTLESFDSVYQAFRWIEAQL